MDFIRHIFACLHKAYPCYGTSFEQYELHVLLDITLCRYVQQTSNESTALITEMNTFECRG